ncbi:hypothetical protein B0H12DRAFT_1072144 [Mycena haematopus]|nr:hypothetical protein B0H12DRAFT_1072144 [Mycena haematopus]
MNSINSTSETVLAPCLSDLSFKRRDSVELGGLSSGAGRRAHKRAKIAPAAQRPARIPHSSLFQPHRRRRFISVRRGGLGPVDILAPCLAGMSSQSPTTSDAGECDILVRALAGISLEKRSREEFEGAWTLLLSPLVPASVVLKPLAGVATVSPLIVLHDRTDKWGAVVSSQKTAKTRPNVGVSPTAVDLIAPVTASTRVVATAVLQNRANAAGTVIKEKTAEVEFEKAPRGGVKRTKKTSSGRENSPFPVAITSQQLPGCRSPLTGDTNEVPRTCVSMLRPGTIYQAVPVLMQMDTDPHGLWFTQDTVLLFRHLLRSWTSTFPIYVPLPIGRTVGVLLRGQLVWSVLTHPFFMCSYMLERGLPSPPPPLLLVSGDSWAASLRSAPWLSPCWPALSLPLPPLPCFSVSPPGSPPPVLPPPLDLAASVFTRGLSYVS